MYDPTLPANGAPLVSAEMRAQLNGLKDLIDAIGAISAAMVDSTSTLPPVSSAGATVSVIGNTLHFTFEIPQGDTGATGPQGSQGEVSLMQLNDAIQTTSANSNSVATLDAPFGDPDTEAPRNKVNELIQMLRRNP